jgi:hypothetical protein
VPPGHGLIGLPWLVRGFVSKPFPRTFLGDRLPSSYVLGSSFFAWSPLQSSFAPNPARTCLLGAEHCCQGFVPLRDITRCVHSMRGIPVLATFRPQVVSTSRRFAPHSDSTGLFHPAAAFRAHLDQGLLSRCSDPSSSEGTPSLPLGHDHSPNIIRCPQPYPSTSRSFSASSSVLPVR